MKRDVSAMSGRVFRGFKRTLAVFLTAVIVFALLPTASLADDPLTLEGLFAGKFRAGTQLFDCQRATSSPYYVYLLAKPMSEAGSRFENEELTGRYFAFRQVSERKVALYLFNENDDSPAYIPEKTDSTGKLGEGVVNVVANEGILFVLDGSWGYFISNAAGYNYGDFPNYNERLILTTDAIVNPTIAQLKKYNASNVLMEAGQILIRFYANAVTDVVSGMPNPPSAIKNVDVDFTIDATYHPTRANYVFSGWNSLPNGTGTTYLPDAVYKSNKGLNLYAQWTLSSGGLQPQAAPQNVSTTNASVTGGNGSITGTTAAMQYRTQDDPNTWYWCSATSTTVPAGEYWVRYAPKDGYSASSESYAGKVLEPAATPIDSDFDIHHLSAAGANDGSISSNTAGVSYEYRIGGVGAYQDMLNDQITGLQISTVEVRKKEVSGVSLASLPVTLYVKRPAAGVPAASLFTVTPVSTFRGYDGSIAGVNNTMQYQYPGDTDWQSISGTSITYLSAGDYKIRYAPDQTTLASESVTMTVTQPAPTHTITFTTLPAARTTLNVGQITGSLTAQAQISPNAYMNINWYECDATGALGNYAGWGDTMTLDPTLPVGTYYYICQAESPYAETVTSNIATVRIVDKYTGPAFRWYQFIEGEGAAWSLSSSGLTFTANGSANYVRNIIVDGGVVPQEYWTVHEGSTVLTLLPEFLETLATGEHTLRIVYLDGFADTVFYTGIAMVPDTGSAPLMVGYALIAAAGLGLLLLSLKKKVTKEI